MVSAPGLSGPGSISGQRHCIALLGKNRDKCQPDGPLGSYADLTFTSGTICYAPRRRVQYCGSELSSPRTCSVNLRPRLKPVPLAVDLESCKLTIRLQQTLNICDLYSLLRRCETHLLVNF